MNVRWRELIAAFLMAVILWYGVSGSEKIESQIEVRVDYRGLPAGMVVRDGLVGRVNVRLRAPLGMLGSLSSRDYAFFMDLSDVHLGENILPFSSASLPFRSGVEVMEISPSRIVLHVDALQSKIVPLETTLQGALPMDYIAHTTLSPSSVSLAGPASLLEGIDRIVVPVTMDSPVIPGVTELTRVLLLPEGVDATPARANVTLQIDIKRKQVKVTRAVRAEIPAQLGRFIRPDKVTMTLNIPESLAAGAAANQGIQAGITLESLELGSYTLPVRATLPEGAELLAIDPPMVTVTIEQKQPARRP